MPLRAVGTLNYLVLKAKLEKLPKATEEEDDGNDDEITPVAVAVIGAVLVVCTFIYASWVRIRVEC